MNSRDTRQRLTLAAILLLIEFLDELVYGAREAAWPLIRTELGLTYTQIGLLLALPNVIGSLLDPPLGILADSGQRRVLIAGGGLAFGGALLLIGTAGNFGWLLLAFTILFPASGAFVGVAQVALMDTNPARHEHLMARWTVAGSLGVVAGPLALGAAVLLGSGWRGLFLTFAGLALLLTLPVIRHHFKALAVPAAVSGLRDGLRAAWQALRRREVLRWLTLLKFSDLMLDILLGFLALYFVDVAGTTPAMAGVAVAIWTGVGLLGDLLLIPLLERVQGLAYLRVSAAITLMLFPAFLLVSGLPLKLILLGLLGLLNAGWYAILKGQFYSALPGQAGVSMAVGAVFGIAAGVIPAGLGLVAEQVGLPAAMWLLTLGPVALLLGIPKTTVR